MFTCMHERDGRAFDGHACTRMMQRRARVGGINDVCQRHASLRPWRSVRCLGEVCHLPAFDSIIGQTQFEGWHLWFQLVIRSVLPQRMSILG
eukprot:UN2436